MRKNTRKTLKPRTRCGGRWTEARYRQFVVAGLRDAAQRWAPKWDAIERTYVGPGRNPRTGKKCKLHKCEGCGGLFPKGAMKADHIEPVVDPVRGFEGFDVFVSRLFVEADGYQVICEGCHDSKTKTEGLVRRGKLTVQDAVRKRTRKKV